MKMVVEKRNEGAARDVIVKRYWGKWKGLSKLGKEQQLKIAINI